MNVLVTGSNGQLGNEIRELVLGEAEATHPKNSEAEATHPKNSEAEATHPEAVLGCAPLGAPNATFAFTDSSTLDITDFKKVKEFIETNKINVIINCAAYTAVDKAEEDEVNADKINHLAVKNLASNSKDKSIKLIHISTDYVFDGENFKPYVEDDITSPNGVYGKTKLDGENAMREINPLNSIIIRTSWVYSSFGANFVKTMLRLGKERDYLGVVFDQVGTPTYARDLARAILEILPKLGEAEATHPKSGEAEATHPRAVLGCDPLGSPNNTQIYNYSNEGVLSWYDFAKEIMKMAKIECQINPIETKEYPTPAKRPHYSLLNKSKIKEEFDIMIPYWKDSLAECLQTMGEKK